MKVLITGAAGFIGSHIADALLSQGHSVIGIDNLSTGRLDNWKGVNLDELVIGDITDGLPAIEPDVIYHCAASYADRNNWEGDTLTNVLGTVKVVRLAQRTGARIVYFQTSLCYGPNPESPVTTDSPLDPHGSYAITKTAGEQFIADSGVPYVSLRLANMYGPRNLSGPVPAFYKRLTAGESCTVVDARRDFVFIDDLVELALKAATDGSGVYHASSGWDYDSPDADFIPRGADDAARLLIDPSATEAYFGWKATTPLSEGIRAAVAWYAEHGVTETYTHLAVKG
jgi:UDP-glucose 4-epimerase